MRYSPWDTIVLLGTMSARIAPARIGGTKATQRKRRKVWDFLDND